MPQHDDSSKNRSSSRSHNNNVVLNPVVWCIIITETAERCAYYGFRAILVLWFTYGLHYTENQAVSLFAATTALAYASPLLGAILADGGLGRYRTILWFGCTYLVGLCLLTLAAYSVGADAVVVVVIGTESNDDNHTEKQHETERIDQPLVLARQLTFAGLLLICIGTGGIKPCVSAFGADQVALDDMGSPSRSGYSDVPFSDDVYESDPSRPSNSSNTNTIGHTTIEPTKEERIQAFFAFFYIGINLGALLAFLAIPMVRSHWGFGAAFFIPTAFMTFALLVFWSQRHSYKHSVPSSSLSKMFQACLILLYQRFRHCSVEGHMPSRRVVSAVSSHEHRFQHDDEGDDNDDDEDAQEKEKQQIFQDASHCLHILPIMLMLPMFWMLYDQQSSVWTFQASRMNLYGLEPEQINVLNTIEIILLVPLFDRVLYPWLKQTFGWKLMPLDRMKWGMCLASISFLASGLVEYNMQAQSQLNTVSVAWQIPQISILAIAEIFLNVTGLEFAYAQAPRTAQALILALYYFTTTLGDGFGAILYSSVFVTMNVAKAMMICAALMLVNTLVFSCVASLWKPFRANPDERQVTIYDDTQEAVGPVRKASGGKGSLELGRISQTGHIA
jgi:proton-dependent oligopeptide transporter, POT family